MTPDLFVRLLLVQYVAAAMAYGWQRDWARAGYWLSAAGIVTSTLYMR